MSKKTHKQILEKELTEFHTSLPEATKEYLRDNGEQMNREAFKAYFTGFVNGREQVIAIVEKHTKRMEEILHK